MIGALAGDIIGRPYEMVNWKSTQFPLFHDKCKPTDDSILTLAIADAFMNNKDIRTTLQNYFHRYPTAGYGMNFKLWAMDRHEEFLLSSGNGSAMRVSPVAYLSDDISEVLNLAKKSAEPSHSEDDGINGAKAIAGCVYGAKHGWSKDRIREFVIKDFYNVDFKYEDLVENYTEDGSWGYTCAKSVPYAIYCFLISNDFEDCIRKSISIGGDSDTIAAMAGSIAEAYYGGVPEAILEKTLSYFKNDVYLWNIIAEFNFKFLPYKYDIQPIIQK